MLINHRLLCTLSKWHCLLAISSAKTVALLSTEAKYMALSDTCQQVKWMKSLFEEISFPFRQVPIHGDNQGLIFIGSNPVQEWRIKHINIHYHYICECIEDRSASVSFLPGCDNPMDMFTKNLPVISFMKFQEQLGIYFQN